MNFLGEGSKVCGPWPSLKLTFPNIRADNPWKKWYPFPTEREIILSF